MKDSMKEMTSMESARMQRMSLVLKKALDMSVRTASAIDLRSVFEMECKDDPDLLDELFETVDSSEVSAHTILSVRQKIETAYHWLCEKHNTVDGFQLLDKLLNEVQSQDSNTQNQIEKQEQEDETMEAEEVPPEIIVNNELIRVMKEEKEKLEQLVNDLNNEYINQQEALDLQKKKATVAIEKLQDVWNQVEMTRNYNLDYGKLTSSEDAYRLDMHEAQ